MSEIRRSAEQLVEAIAGLARANRLTGIWDNRRFQECKKPFKQVDAAYLYQTEKLSRHNVELRARHRTAIDVAFERLLAARTAQSESARAKVSGTPKKRSGYS